MEIHERVKKLRKEILHLSQTEFGEQLGVSRSVINNIERNVLARPDQKEPLYKLICKEYHVSYDWLMNGEGEPFNEDADEDEYTRAATEIGIKDPVAKQAVIDYWKLSDEDKKLFRAFMERFISKKEGDV